MGAANPPRIWLSNKGMWWDAPTDSQCGRLAEHLEDLGGGGFGNYVPACRAVEHVQLQQPVHQQVVDLRHAPLVLDAVAVGLSRCRFRLRHELDEPHGDSGGVGEFLNTIGEMKRVFAAARCGPEHQSLRRILGEGDVGDGRRQ
jgi:hypothetical protein